MRVRLRFFATLREQLGETAERDVGRATTVAALWRALVEEKPALRKVRVRFAVDEAYVDDGYVLGDGDEVAVFPPVSGGR
jgi:molybdopterin converting factor subunit 1